MRTIRFHCQTALILAVLAATPAFTQSTPATQRGFAANAAHSIGSFDSINVFNGNLTLSIPVGPRLAVGDGSFAYGLTANYNSSIWDIQGSNGQVYTAWGNTETLRIKPNRTSNAGLGWILTLGELITRAEGADGLAYVDPSGAVHTFYQVLSGGNLQTVDSTSPLGFTRDSSHIRLRKLTATGDQPRMLVETRDGIIREFRCSPCSTINDTRWHLKVIRDVAGNRLDLVYPLPVPSSGTWSWSLKEAPANHPPATFTRTHTINYELDPHRHPEGRQWRVSSVGFANGAQYTFAYGQRTLRRDGGCVRHPDGTYNTLITLSVLDSVTLPDGTKWKFLYHHDSADGSCSGRGGRVRQVDLPAGGRVEYQYGLYNFISRVCDETSSPRPPMQRVFNNEIGVTRKTVSRFEEIFVSGEKTWQWVKEGEWVYAQDVDPYETVAVEDCRLPKEYRRVVVDALGNKTLHYFSAYLGGDSEGGKWNMLEYGLPITKRFPPVGEADSQGTIARPMYRSTETWQCPAPPNPNTPPPPFSTAGCTKLRERYLRLETDGSVAESETSIVHTNQRVAGERTLFYEPPPSTDGCTKSLEPYLTYSYTDAQHTQYDGIGHYRQTVTMSDFAAKNGGGGGDSRTSFTNYNSPCATDRQCPNWLLHVYDETFIQEASHAEDGLPVRKSKRTATFDSTGFLTAERVIADMTTATQGNDDLLIDYLRELFSDGTATVTELRRLAGGGDQFRYRRTYRFGSLQRNAQIALSGDAELLVLERNTVQPQTGLITRTEDASGTGTTYVYDLLGRVVGAQNDGEAQTVYAYSPAVTVPPSGASPRLPSVTATTTGAAGASLLLAAYRYDSLGRLIAEEKRMPGGKTNEKTTTYNAMGWKTSESVVGEKNSSKRRRWFENHDPFGRVGKIVQPDDNGPGQQSKVCYAYFGIRATHTSIQDRSLHPFLAKVEKYDAQGRLVAVQEPAPNSDSLDTTWYGYHPTGDLGRVTQGAQIRRFLYDGRGFLKSERVPELQNVATIYAGHNALGRPGSRWHQGGGDVLGAGVVFTYDALGRVSRISQRLPGGGRGQHLKEYEYYASSTDPCNPGNDVGRAAGKLHIARRHNFVRNPRLTSESMDVVVSEIYAYDGSNGKVARRTTEVQPRNDPAFSFVTTVKYDSLGNIRQVKYPSCAGGACSGAPMVDRTVDYQYTDGLLTNVNGYASIGYHINGLVKQIQHTTGPRDEVWIADDGLARPESMFTVADAGWQSGTYKYDARGNILEIGPDRYTYDKGNRLLSATVAGVSQTFAYDRWGNLTTYAGVALSPGGTTNRLGVAGTAYTFAGSLKTWKDPRRTASTWGTQPYEFEYDELNVMTRMRGPAPAPARPVGRVFLYTADDERIATIDYQHAAGIAETWSVRGLGNQVLREYRRTVNFATDQAPEQVLWAFGRDYIYRGSSLLASETTTEGLRYHLDHLGNTRLVTDGTGAKVSSHDYLPFGEEIGSPGTTGPRMKFTGHERDDDGSISQLSDFDYMHARYYLPVVGRFLSTDPLRGRAASPQSWNRYAYALNNPVRLTDPDGRQTIGSCGDHVCYSYVVNGRLVQGIVPEGVPSPLEQQQAEDLETVATFILAAEAPVGALALWNLMPAMSISPELAEKMFLNSMIGGMTAALDEFWEGGFAEGRTEKEQMTTITKLFAGFAGGAIGTTARKLGSGAEAVLGWFGYKLSAEGIAQLTAWAEDEKERVANEERRKEQEDANRRANRR